jgi:hypothetical protein
MLSRLVRSSVSTHVLALMLGASLAWLALPLWRQAIMAFNQDDYGLLVAQCDGAMRVHFQAKRELELDDPSDKNSGLAASELGLLICQDYDLYQKRLMQWGLRESELAQMRLKAIEAQATDLEEVIETHEIRF